MKLHTKIPLEKESNSQIDYNSNVLLLGSCFVENIGKKIEYFKFQNLQNPFGILFNPIVIERLVKYAIEGKIYTEEDVFFNNERWYCYDSHSDLSVASKEALLQNLNSAIKSTTQQFSKAIHIVITLGTAWVYNHIETNQIVANCHKVPQKEFNKELLSVDRIYESLKSIVDSIHSVNPKASIIFTVSPVRHLKDGFVENQQSKSHLITAVHKLLNQKSSIENHQSHYFPSYELMMDELRDYRFYAEDMIHPNQTAINYIWEKFKQVWISTEALKTMDEVESVQKGISHKPFNPESSQHIEFMSTIKKKQLKLGSEFSHIKF